MSSFTETCQFYRKLPHYDVRNCSRYLSVDENRKSSSHICSFDFLKMNRESIQKFHVKKVDTSKVNFCLRIICRLICCESVNEAIVLYQLGIVVMTNKKITTDIEKFVQKWAKTVNFIIYYLKWRIMLAVLRQTKMTTKW